MSWFEDLLRNSLSYSIVIVPVLLLVQNGQRLTFLLRDSPLLLSLLTWVIGKQGPNSKGALQHQNADEYEKKSFASPIIPPYSPLAQYIQQFKQLTATIPPQWKTALNFMFCLVGLQLSFLSWGVLQERMVTRTYNGKKFNDSVFMVFANRSLAFIIGTLVVFLQDVFSQNKTDGSGSTPGAFKYMLAALSNIMATWFQYEALKFVSFPLQVLSKTCKIIATMLVGRFFVGKSFSTQQYAVAISITLGVTLFVFGNEMSEQQSQSSHIPNQDGHSSGQLIVGSILLACYLIFDSLTSNWEEKLFHVYPDVGSYNMMAGVNCWGTILTAVALSTHGGFSEAFTFMQQSYEFTFHVILLAIASATGSLFIYHTISSFGAVTFASIMTVRQALAIFLSCIIYGHAITPLGFCGLLFVFVALGAQLAMRKHQKKATSSSQKDSHNHLSHNDNKHVIISFPIAQHQH